MSSQKEPDELILNSFILTIKQAIRDKRIPVDNPFSIITKAMEILEKVKGLPGAEKKLYIMRAIETVAKGEDGIFGTADDLIPEKTVIMLKNMVEQNIIGDTIQLITDASKGKFDINQAKPLISSILNMFISCFRKN
jgi:hypothetical protein